MIPNSVTSIGGSTFQDCTSLTDVMIPSGVTSIGGGAFFGCTGLTAITVDALNASYLSLDGILFDKSQTALIQCPGGKSGSYMIPSGITSIGDCAFASCANVTSVTIPDSVTGVGYEAFSFCTGLTAITVDSRNASYSSMEGVLFDKNQTTLIQFPGAKAGNYAIPESVTTIGDYAFASCAKLTSVTIPESVTSIGYEAFPYCTNLNAITIDALNASFSSVNGVLFDKSQTTLIQYPGGKGGSYTIPDSVTGLGVGAFAGCTRLTGVTIPDSLTTIEDHAFAGCYSLCSVTIPNSITYIADYAFGECTNLTSITIPTSVDTIGSSAFQNCANLTAVYFQGNEPDIGDSLFYGDDQAIVYYLPGTTGWGATFAGRPTAMWNPNANLLTTINQAANQADPTALTPLNFTVVFSQPVTDFTVDDVTLDGTAGATTKVVTGSGTTYNVAVSGMTQAGTVIASIAAGVAHDAAGNANDASASMDNSVTYLHVNHLAFGVAPADTVAGVKMSPAVVVWVEDAFGQIVVSDNQPVTFKLTGPANKTIKVKARNGVATIPNLTLTKAGVYSLTALHAGYQDAPPVAFNVIPAAATKMVFTLQPSSTIAGNTFAAQVTLKDRYGNVATNDVSSVTLTTSPAGWTDTQPVQNGTASFTGTLTMARKYKLVATDGTLKSVSSRNFTISPESASSRLVLLQPLPPTATAPAGKTIKPAIKVAVEDQFGNVIKANHTLVTMAITSGPSNAILKGTTTRKFNNGTATFNNLSLTLAGSYTLEISDLSLAVATPIALTVPVT
jgi:hypothetical protein